MKDSCLNLHTEKMLIINILTAAVRQSADLILLSCFSFPKIQSIVWHTVVKIISYMKRLFVVVLLFYVHGKHLRSCRDGQLT